MTTQQLHENGRQSSLSVVGIGLRLPGARDKKEFFELLKEGRSAISRVPDNRWNPDRMTAPGGIPGKVVTDLGGFVEPHTDIDLIEFGISPAEAKSLDPHQAMLVEGVFQALEDSGVHYRGTNTGVFVTGSPDVHNLGNDMYDMGPYSATGAAFSMQANRLSYMFDLRGPSVYLDTACSSSITCLHLARTAILRGDCDMAVVAAVNVILAPHASLSFSTLGTLSPTGICHTFDSSADGYSRGEGCTVIILQRTKDAIDKGSHIYAEITGTSINANGKGKSITMPDGPQQKAATYAAYRDAGREPHEAAYVECHGTGTPVGDPIEANAVGEVFTPGRADGDYLRIGSAKTNVGHLEPAAGLVGLIKNCYTLDMGLMLPHLHFKNPTPRIRWNEFKIKVQTETEPLPPSKLTKEGKFIVSLSSFGFGGANSHTVMERVPNKEPGNKTVALTDKDPMLISVGALSNRAVTKLSESLQEVWPGIKDPLKASLLARTMTERARGHPNTAFAVASMGEPLSFSDTMVTSTPDLNPIKAFVFCGQGPQHEHMGVHMYTRFAAFRNSVNASFEMVAKFHKKNFQDEYGLFNPELNGKVAKTDKGDWKVECIVIAITIFQIALFDLWVDLGVQPDVVLGHSVGEIAAMYASGALTHEKAIRTAIARSNALSLLDTIDGQMAALGMSRREAEQLIQRIMKENGTDTGLWVSASNSTNAVAVSGKTSLLEQVVADCESRQIFARLLRVGGPYHSPMVSPCGEPFLKEVSPVINNGENIPKTRFISTVEGRMHEPGRNLDAQYCWQNVSRPVMFRESIEALNEYRKKEDRGLLIIEIAPHTVLGSYMDEILRAANAENTTIVASGRRPNYKKGETGAAKVEITQLLTAVGTSIQSGVRDLKVYKLYSDEFIDMPMGANATLDELPSYPFLPLKKAPHETNIFEYVRCHPPVPPLATGMIRINAQTHSWTKGHKIRGTIVFPGAGYAEAALENGARTITNMRILRAFVLEEEGAPKHAQFKLTGINNGWEFRSSGKGAVNDTGLVYDQLHASGQMWPESTPIGPANIKELFGDNWIEDFDIIMDGETFYSRLRPNGSMHTGAFGLINEVRGSTKREDDYLAFVDVPEDLWTSHEAYGMVFHPGLLDSAFLCTWIPALSFEGQKLGVDAFLPNHLDILSVRGTVDEIHNAKRLVLHVQTLISNDTDIKHNVLMFDRDTGKTLAFLKGLECKRIKDTGRVREGYTESWEPRAFDASPSLMEACTMETSVASKFLENMNGDDQSGVVSQALKMGLVSGTPLQDALFDVPSVSLELNEGMVALVDRLIMSSVSKTPRRVFRVLEMYARHRKVNMQPIVAMMERRGIYVDLVRLNVANDLRGSDEFLTGPYDISASVEEFERAVPASFDVAIASDVLRVSSDNKSTMQSIEELLVPGGVAMYCEVTPSTPFGKLFYGRAPAPLSSLGLQPFGASPLFSLGYVRRDEKAWPAIPAIPNKPSADESSLFSSLSDDELVYFHQLGTEYLLPQAVRDFYKTDTPVGKVWIVADDTVEGAAALGLAGTLTNEMLTVKGIYIAVDPSMPRAQRAGLLDLLHVHEEEGSLEMFNAIRNGRLYGRRLVKQPEVQPANLGRRDWVLENIQGQTASIKTLAPHMHFVPKPSDHDVIVQTDAVALNFKNVLSAIGLLPAEDCLSEFSGIVREVGPKVTRVRVGDRVMGTSGGVREGIVATASEFAMTKVPANMTPLQAAAFPIAYGTVWHGLVQLAQIRPGETILIHAAAGGVGLCAIQIAQRHGLEVFCTVSSKEKRDFIHNHLGVPYENMANSRSIGEWTQGGRDWLAKRGKTGFDVVLNSLQGLALQAGIDVLGYLGRFVDISKRDHLAGNPMSMSSFLKAINYIAVELGLLGRHAPERMASLLDEVAAVHAREPFKVMYNHVFEGAKGLIESYELMESGKHIGKIVTDLSACCQEQASEKLWDPTHIFDPRKSYVLVGGCGGLGPRLAGFLINYGARNIIMTGRRGHISRSDRLALERLVSDPAFPHVTIKIMAADALKPEAMKDVFATANSLGPLGGVFLMSVVLRDDQFLNMDKEKFDTVMNSKIGALNVIRNTIDIDALDFLFLFSSTSALFFNPGQINYNAAQTYFNRFACEHNNVISYAVPAISDIGVYAELRSRSSSAAMKVMDALACPSRELCESVMHSLGRCMLGGPNHAGYFIQTTQWDIMNEISLANAWSISHLLEHHDDDGDKQDESEEDADPVGVLVGKLLNVDIATVDDTMFLSTLGLDSLSASKLSAILLAEFGTTFTQLQLLGPVSVSTLRQVVAETQAAKEGDDAAPTKKGGAPSKGKQAKSKAKTPTDKGVDNSALLAFDYASQPDKLDDLRPSLDGLVPFDASVLSPDREPKVLVTGATGYMGATVLESVLEAFPLAKVYALVRGVSSAEAGLTRIKEVATKRHLKTLNHIGRVTAVPGDASKPKLGISNAEYAVLASELDLIVHAAGKADHLMGYQAIVNDNVLSTLEVLRLASEQKVKAVVNIGSTNMWLSFSNKEKNDEVIKEDVDLDALSTGLFNGYSQSKWVSEQLCLRASKRGVPVITVRPGVLGGNARSKYVPNEDSFMWRMFVGCQQLGYVPNLSSSAMTETPADWFSEIFGKLISSPRTWRSNYHAFHIRYERPVEVDTMPTLPGHARPKAVSHDAWVDAFNKEASNPHSTNLLTPLRHFVAKGELAHLPHFDQSRTKEVLGDAWSECPPYQFDFAL